MVAIRKEALVGTRKIKGKKLHHTTVKITTLKRATGDDETGDPAHQESVTKE